MGMTPSGSGPPDEFASAAPAERRVVLRHPSTSLVSSAVVIVLVGLVAVSSRGAPLLTPLRVGSANRSEVLANIAVVAGVGVAAAFALTFLIHRTLVRSRPGAPPMRETLHRAVPITSVALAALVLLTIARTDLDPSARGASGGHPDQVAKLEGGRPPGPGLSDSRIGILVAGEDRRPDPNGGANDAESAPLDPKLLLLLAAVSAAVVGVVFQWSRTRPSPMPKFPGPGDESDPDLDIEPLRAAVLGTIDAMLADPDPNTAVIGAYARLLEGLAACGAERRAHEAPLEHLRRVFATLQVRPEPARQLLELFQAARFSTHRLTVAHREQALEALHAAACDLADARVRAASQPAGARR